MRKKIYVVLILIILVACTKEIKIEVNKRDSGYKIENLTSVGITSTVLSLWGNTNIENGLLSVIECDENDNVKGYIAFDIDTNKVTKLSKNEPPELENEKYGWLTIPTSEYNVYYKIVSDYETQMNDIKCYVEKDGNFTLLHETIESMNLIDKYFQIYLYEENDKAYLIFEEGNELVINEITSNGFIEIERKPIYIDDYKLVSYEYNNELILIYKSKSNLKIVINDEEYVTDINSNFIIFDEIMVISNYIPNQKVVLQSYVIDRKTNEIIELEEKIDCLLWKQLDNNYYKFDSDTGYLILLSYKDNIIDIITTSYNKYAFDRILTSTIDNKLIVMTIDYTINELNYDLITFE